MCVILVLKEIVTQFQHQKLKKEFLLNKNEHQMVNALRYQTAQNHTRIRFFSRCPEQKKERTSTLA